jgi:hypothetical protein
MAQGVGGGYAEADWQQKLMAGWRDLASDDEWWRWSPACVE